MRISPSPVVCCYRLRKTPVLLPASECCKGNVSACAKFHRRRALLTQNGLVDDIEPAQRCRYRTIPRSGAVRREPRRDLGIRLRRNGRTDAPFSNRFAAHMDNLSGYANRPFPFVLRYLRGRLASHVVILSSVVAAVAC